MSAMCPDLSKGTHRWLLTGFAGGEQQVLPVQHGRIRPHIERRLRLAPKSAQHQGEAYRRGPRHCSARYTSVIGRSDRSPSLAVLARHTGRHFGDGDQISFGIGNFCDSDPLLGSFPWWAADLPAHLGCSL